MKKMYAILAVLFIALAALIIYVFVDDQKKSRDADAASSQASADESVPEGNTKKTSETEEENDILPSLPFTTALSFQAAKVKDVPGERLLVLEYYDTEDEEAKLVEDEQVKNFDFTPFKTTGEVDDDYLVYSFCYIYEVSEGQLHNAVYEDIEAGDMVLLLQDYSKHYYLLIYK